MARRARVQIIIPVYNEEPAIGGVLREIMKAGHRNIIVVDDGSGDNTATIARRHKVLVLRHLLNRGKGAAVKTGIMAAKSLQADIVVTFDGDGQHDPEDIGLLLIQMRQGYDVVLGKRDFRDKHIPFYRVVGNLFGNALTWLLYGLWVSDSQSGLRAYSRKALSAIHTTTDRYEYDSEVIREIKRHNLKYREMPMHVRYTSYSMGKTNKQTVVNSIKMALKMLISG